MATKFFACPAHRCSAPGRFFHLADDAQAFAREASDAYRVGYSAWAVRVGRWTLLARFDPHDDDDQAGPTPEA
jgi:hypothetical protein